MSDPVQTIRDADPAKLAKLLDAYAPHPVAPPAAALPRGLFSSDPIAPGLRGAVVPAGEVLARAAAHHWLGEALPYPERHPVVTALLSWVAGMGLTIGGLVFVCAAISKDPAFIGWSALGLGLFGVVPTIIATKQDRQGRRWRLVAVEGETVAAYVSDLTSPRPRADNLPLLPVWRLPLSEIERLEVGPAAPYVTGRAVHYEETVDIFTMWRGRRVVVHRAHNLVADALTAARHDLLEMLASVRPAAAPAAAARVAAAPSPSTPEKGFSL